MIAAFAGLLLTLKSMSSFRHRAQVFCFPTMAAVFIGGTSIAGGLGSITGTFFGAYIIGSLEAGVVATTISGYWVQLIEGLVMGSLGRAEHRHWGRTHHHIINRIRHWVSPDRSDTQGEGN